MLFLLETTALTTVSRRERPIMAKMREAKPPPTGMKKVGTKLKPPKPQPPYTGGAT